MVRILLWFLFIVLIIVGLWLFLIYLKRRLNPAKYSHSIVLIFLRILLIIVIIVGLWSLVVINAIWPRIVPLVSQDQMKGYTGFSFTGADDLVGYSIRGPGRGSSWIRFQITPDELNLFLQKNGLEGKLTTEGEAIAKAVSLNTGGIRMEATNTKVFKDWIPSDFIPISAYTHPYTANFEGELGAFSILVGKKDPASSTFSVYICKF